MAAAIMRAGEGKPPRRGLSAHEQKLWSDVTRSVAPLRRQPLPPDPEPPTAPSKIKTKPRSKPSRAPVRSAPPAARPTVPLEPFDRRLKQRLARGTEAIDFRVDLHGKTQSEAYAALSSFLRRAQRDGAKFVLVITGKGGGGREDGGERGVLKRQVPQWLGLPEFRRYVLGFEDAHHRHGGAGALYLRIRRQKSGPRQTS
ncbi:MAG TPA: Smr/MutS family protein [Xanthobacteraceae bacterium]|nr:Smr/MutS family protein [Xanthobacteraceae bacterium]